MTLLLSCLHSKTAWHLLRRKERGVSELANCQLRTLKDVEDWNQWHAESKTMYLFFNAHTKLGMHYD